MLYLKEGMSTKVLATAAVATSVAAGIIGVYYVYKRTLWEKLKESKLKRILSMLESDKNCHIKDGAMLRGKLRTLLDGGKNKFQILTDFDKTLTSYFVDGGAKGHSSFQVIEESSHIGESVAERLKLLHAKYYPIEMSPTISIEEKTPLMIEWYKSSLNIGITSGISKYLIPSMVKETRVMLRPGMDEFLGKIRKFNIPLLIVSAGLGDIIDEVFIQQTVLPPQVSVFANYYEFDEDGVSVGLKNEEMLHTFNKDKTYTMNKSYFDSHKHCINAFVMGDTLGDPDMTNNIEYMKCLLKIGFLNNDVDLSLSQYLCVYDLVLTRDASMDVISVLLLELFNE